MSENWTPSRRRAIELLWREHQAGASVRVGRGMWDDDGPPAITRVTAQWLCHSGYAVRVDGRLDGLDASHQWLALTGAGAKKAAELEAGPG